MGSRASQVPAAPMGAVQWGGRCWGAAGVSASAWQQGSPRPQHSPCGQRAVKKRGGVSGSVFVWTAVLFGINLLF